MVRTSVIFVTKYVRFFKASLSLPSSAITNQKGVIDDYNC